MCHSSVDAVSDNLLSGLLVIVVCSMIAIDLTPSARYSPTIVLIRLSFTYYSPSLVVNLPLYIHSLSLSPPGKEIQALIKKQTAQELSSDEEEESFKAMKGTPQGATESLAATPTSKAVLSSKSPSDGIAT